MRLVPTDTVPGYGHSSTLDCNYCSSEKLLSRTEQEKKPSSPSPSSRARISWGPICHNENFLLTLPYVRGCSTGTCRVCQDCGKNIQDTSASPLFPCPLHSLDTRHTWYVHRIPFPTPPCEKDSGGHCRFDLWVPFRFLRVHLGCLLPVDRHLR